MRERKHDGTNPNQTTLIEEMLTPVGERRRGFRHLQCESRSGFSASAAPRRRETPLRSETRI